MPTRTCLQNGDGDLKSYTCLLLQHEFTKFITGHHLLGVTTLPLPCLTGKEKHEQKSMFN
jgi:hypothetical protein